MRAKYPRTMNFPWSDSNSSDDVWWKDSEYLRDQHVVVTEKLDGECTTIYPDGHVHARSIDTRHHPSRSWVKALAARIAHEIPDGFKIFGENVFAWHSIFYTELPSYFLVFGIYNENVCLPWEETVDICDMLSLSMVPVVYEGIWDEKIVRETWKGVGAFPTFKEKNGETCEAEGYVARVAESFIYEQFRCKCAKYVRENHVTTTTQWMTREVIPNLLMDNPDPP